MRSGPDEAGPGAGAEMPVSARAAEPSHEGGIAETRQSGRAGRPDRAAPRVNEMAS